MGQDELRALVESCDVEGAGSGKDLGVKMETHGVWKMKAQLSFWRYPTLSYLIQNDSNETPDGASTARTGGDLQQ